MQSRILPQPSFRRRYEPQQTLNHPSRGDRPLASGMCPTQTGTSTTSDQRNATLTGVGISKAKYLVGHIWNKFMEVLHRFIYVHCSGPFALGSMRSPYGAVGSTEGCQLGTLGGRVHRQHNQEKHSLLTDVGNSSSISELPTRDGPSYPKREDGGYEIFSSNINTALNGWYSPHPLGPQSGASEFYPTRPTQPRLPPLQAIANLS